MINQKIVPNIDIFSRVNSAPSLTDFSKKGFGVNALNEEGQSFKDVLSGIVSNVNSEIQKPDQLMNQQLTGNPDVDIHDVMTSVAKAELGISLATQVTSKVINAYNQVMQISI